LYKDTYLVKLSVFMEIQLVVLREVGNRQIRTDNGLRVFLLRYLIGNTTSH